MKNYTRLYLNEMGYDESDFIPCEVCGVKAVDIHHIDSRKAGGSKTKDTIENLMALCRKCHNEKGDIKEFKQQLIDIHLKHYHERNTRSN